ncbi:MAG: hypothetical protein Fur0021_26490 [Candidatus Promineifilaceae bacterium]
MSDNQPAAAPPAVREAMVHHYLFLARSLENAAAVEKLPASVWQAWQQGALKHQQTWLGTGGTTPAAAQLPGVEVGRQQLYPPDQQPARWQRGANEYAAFAFAQAAGDAVTIHLGYGRSGAADAATWARLEAGVWFAPEPLPDSPFYLGQTICYAGRAASATDGRRQAEQLLPGVGGDLRLASLPWGGWLYDRVGLPDRLALFYPDDDAAEQAAGRFLNQVLPDLAVLVHKVSHQYSRIYWQRLRPQLEQREQALSRVLLRGRALAQNLTGLEGQLGSIAAAYGHYAADLGQFAQAMQGVRINAANLEEEMGWLGLPPAGALLAWRQGAAVAVAQMQADKAFYEATVQEAEVTLRTLQIQVDLQRGQIEAEENRLTEWRNGWLAVIGILLALGEYVDRELAYSLLCAVVTGMGRVCDPMDQLPGLALPLLRVGIVAGVGLLLWGGVRLWRRAAAA